MKELQLRANPFISDISVVYPSGLRAIFKNWTNPMVDAITYFSFISASIYGCFQDLVCLQKSCDGQIIIKI